MAKGAVITSDVRSTIARVFIEHEDWRAKEIQKEVHKRLSEINPNIAPGWPGLSAIQKEVTKLRQARARKLILTESGEDVAYDLETMWTLGTLWKHDISAEALPSVLKVWAHLAQNYGYIMTIRQAKQVSKLYRVIEDIDTLALMSVEFAVNEIVLELLYKTEHIDGFGMNLENNANLYSLMAGKQFTMRFPPDSVVKVIDPQDRFNKIREAILKKPKPNIIFREVGNERSHSKKRKE